MKLNERQLEIIRLLEHLGQLEVSLLVSRFKTSAVTIRKDLELLQKKGILLRTHGGAILAENVEQTVPIRAKLLTNTDSKNILADLAVKMIHNCKTVALDAGSTTLAVAKKIQKMGVTIVTNSLLIANELADSDSGDLILLGGIWRRESSCFIGPQTLEMLDSINIDIAFIGFSGFSVESGFSCQNVVEAQIKRRMLEKAGRRFLIGDSSKFGHNCFSTFSDISSVSALITDSRLSTETRTKLNSVGLNLITPQE